MLSQQWRGADVGGRMCKDTAGVGRDISAAAEDCGGATRAAPTLLGCSNEATLPGHCIPAGGGLGWKPRGEASPPALIPLEGASSLSACCCLWNTEGTRSPRKVYKVK